MTQLQSKTILKYKHLYFYTIVNAVVRIE